MRKYFSIELEIKPVKQLHYKQIKLPKVIYMNPLFKQLL